MWALEYGFRMPASWVMDVAQHIEFSMTFWMVGSKSSTVGGDKANL